jgi:deazaflavin-dependent oxidoreductase (nitroreductase family)
MTAPQNEPQDSPIGWVNKHIQQYVESGGEQGHHWRGVPTLLLTVTGRKTGLSRRTALIYAVDGDDVIVIASNGGSQDHPLWYRNLVADPRVRVQVGTKSYDAIARTAGPQERQRLWELAVAVFPTYESYAQKATREIPVVVLTPAGP